jgi:N-methylhydantoinase B
MDVKGEVVAQHVVLPLHIGAFPACTAAVIEAFAGSIAEGDAFIINHPYHGGSPHAPDIAVITPIFVAGEHFGFCGSIAHKSDIGGPVPGSCSGQAREIFNEGLHLPAVRYQARYRPNADLERLIGANSRTPELVLGDIRGQLGADRLGEKRLNELVGKGRSRENPRLLRPPARVVGSNLKSAIAEWTDGRFEAERFVDDDGIDQEKPVRIHVVVEKAGDKLHLDFSGSADQTKGPANIRPPLVEAACAYALISLIDPGMYVSSGLVRGFRMTAREGSVLNPRFPAPVNTYNPTIHALVDAIFDAMSHIAPGKVRADGSGSRSIILGGRSTYTGKGTCNTRSSPAAPVRRDEGRHVGDHRRPDQCRDRADRDHRGEFPSRQAFRADRRFRRRRRIPRRARHTSGISQPRGCPLLDPFDEARDAKRLRRGAAGRPGDIWINPDTDRAKRLTTRYADYPLQEGDVFRLDTPGGGGHGDPLARDPERVLADVEEGVVSEDAAERAYCVVLEQARRAWALDRAATQARRTQLKADRAKR